MKVLFIVPYPSEGPSNRFRVEQYFQYLKNGGIYFSLRPFFSANLYKILYKKSFLFKKILSFIFFTLRRAYDIIDSRNYDVVFIHREAFPFGSLFEYFFCLTGKKIIYDFDDAIFLPNVSDSNKLIEALKDTTKIEKIIKMSDRVIAGNNFLKDYALGFNKNVSVLPTPIDTDKYRPLPGRRVSSAIVVGWIGSTTTVKYLDILLDVFRLLLQKYNNVKFIVVGGIWQRINSPMFMCKEWRLESEIEDLQSFDIGIMPLKDDDWSKGKCAFKIIEYMSVGIPVVASDVGMNSEIIRDGVNGFLAINSDEWIRKLSLLIDKTELRVAIGQAGRQTVEEKYSLKVNAPKFIDILKNIYKD